jgi:hypothetical protein
MTDEEILEELRNSRTIVVGNTWYFTGRAMSCSNTDGDFVCCEDYYDTIETALGVIRSFSDKVEKL